MTTPARACTEILTQVEGRPLRGMADLDAGMLLGVPQVVHYAPGPHKTVPPSTEHVGVGTEAQAVSPRRRTRT
ncbi:MAG TPA: hypothetical protein VNG33_21950 [Polyangiaceae bacterium]|nr:hypothetical protein [Polyangiaceae bacterium]